MSTELRAQAVEWAAAGAVAMGAKPERPVLFRRPDWVNGEPSAPPPSRPSGPPGEMRTLRGPAAASSGDVKAEPVKPADDGDYSGAITYLAMFQPKARRDR